jgi:hypothetical protein
MLGRSISRGTIIAALLVMALSTAALAYGIYMTLPLNGSVFDTGKMVGLDTQTCTNDDGGGCGPWDADEGAGLGDPIAAVANLVSGGSVTRATNFDGAAENIQNCTAVVGGDGNITVTMNNTFGTRRCAVQAAFLNKTGKSVKVVGAILEGAPPLTLRVPPSWVYSDSCAARDNAIKVYFELTPTTGAPVGAWAAADVKVQFETIEGACPQ